VRKFIYGKDVNLSRKRNGRPRNLARIRKPIFEALAIATPPRHRQDLELISENESPKLNEASKGMMMQATGLSKSVFSS
jgi:hypothetical protein